MTSNEVDAAVGVELLTEAEAAAFLRLKPDTLRAWRTREKLRGRGPAYIQKKRWAHVRYLRSDLIAWLHSQRHDPQPSKTTKKGQP